MNQSGFNAAPLLEVKDLRKHYPLKRGLFARGNEYVRAVDGLNFTINQGETLGIVGESGCGKSTTGEMVAQLLEPSSGEIWFEGRRLTGMNEQDIRQVRRELQIVFQDPYASLNPRMTVKDIVGEPLKIHGLAKGRELQSEVVQLLETVGLGAHQLDRYPHEFSGGQRQRIGIARALALKPKLIVCDEPVSALDVSIQAQILNLLKSLQQQFSLTYIFIAHGLPSVKHISDRIAVMYLGRIVELADRDDLFARPKHPYTQALLSAVPVPDPTIRKERIVLSGELPSAVNPPTGCAFHPRCPYVQPICKIEAPALEPSGSRHMAACHFPLN
ncbi:ABC transporter ATP-binding protein [Paenibacillus sp. Leaf72]|uniref:ABC transporter ATP-binding protein n=1 Tax=Paenibacillus sp. Leaf72 TaxID=1736234 RepID=UPI0006FC6F69|nr:dipeptide ABC transporter ATP-binding protein [Paenibacillus sp. Leaf72]KQO12409.1 peptide ABC transporter substrate-binding protein [Paenibacillus sp. Leaf72]